MGGCTAGVRKRESSSQVVHQRAWRVAADDVEGHAWLGLQTLQEGEQRGGVADRAAVDPPDDVPVAQAEAGEQAAVADLEQTKARRAAVAYLGDGTELGQQRAHVVARAGE